MMAAPGLDHFLRRSVQHDQANRAIFGVAAGHHDYRCTQLWHLYLPFLARSTNLLIHQAGVKGKQGYSAR